MMANNNVMCDATCGVIICNHARITGEHNEMDATMVVSVVLLAITGIMATECYIILRRARKEYEKAKESVEDIILSFNRQLRNESEKLERVAFKVESFVARSEGAIRKADEAVQIAKTMETMIVSSSMDESRALAKVDELGKQMDDVITSQTTLSAKITNIEERARQLSINPEVNIDAVIPIKRDRALALLTETELAALELLAAEGPKTAPEIKERVKLSREHTARLMKKLYEGGYLERDTGKVPFKYSVKKEMGKLLKKNEGETT